jgi:hypothetical protein
MDASALILSGRTSTAGDSRTLTRAATAGELTRLRRGAYVETATWIEASAHDQHLLRMHAAVAASGRRLVFAAHSAAAAWGMPVLHYPDHVAVQEAWEGGGRSAPGVRRISAGGASAHHENVQGFAVTSIARTALELTRLEPFADALGSMDWALWHKNPQRITPDAIAAELATLPPRFGIARTRRVIHHASALSDSFGESRCFGMIVHHGFARPVRQQRFTIAGKNYDTDYYWPSVGVAGEFDGKGKYLRSLREGENPGDVVWREKLREDALRTVVRGMVRPVWADLENPAVLVGKLIQAGVPRANRSDWR